MSAFPRLIAFDLDGTLTQHRTPLSAETAALLDRLRKRFPLLIIGAGSCERIHKQLNGYPIDIIGNYGMQTAAYNEKSGTIDTLENACVPVNSVETAARINILRKQFGFERYCGASVEFHDSGMITFPLLGTRANIEDKIRFDPDRSRRKPMYESVCCAFHDYKVFIGGSSSFDIVPKPYNKLYALKRYCKAHDIPLEKTVYAGDDYGKGGNDEDVYQSGVPFLCVDNYLHIKKNLQPLLEDAEAVRIQGGNGK